MRASTITSAKSLDKKRILTKALIRMADWLALSRQELQALIGKSESSLCRLYTKSNAYLDPESKEGQLAILLLRIYRNLDALFGGNAKQAQDWLRSENKDLRGKPVLIMQNIEGLIAVLHYLEKMTGKI